MKHSRRLVRLVTIAVCLGNLCLWSEEVPELPTNKNQVVAVVNGDIITMIEVLRSMPIVPRPESLPEIEWLKLRLRLFKDRLDSLIDRKLLYQEAKLAEVALDEAVVSQYVEKRWKAMDWTREQFLDHLKKMRMTESEFGQQVREDLMAGEIVRRRIGLDRSISPAELTAYFEENKDEFSEGEKRHVRIILTPLKLNDGKDGATFARDLVKRLRTKPEDFAKVAKDVSTGPNKETGGDFGWVEKSGGLKRELLEAAFALPERGISDPIQTDGGYFIVKVDALQRGTALSFEDAQPTIRRKIQSQRYMDDRKKLLDDLKRRGYVVPLLPDPELLR